MRKLRCWYCGLPGHIGNKCQKFQLMDNRNSLSASMSRSRDRSGQHDTFRGQSSDSSGSQTDLNGVRAISSPRSPSPRRVF